MLVVRYRAAERPSRAEHEVSMDGMDHGRTGNADPLDTTFQLPDQRGRLSLSRRRFCRPFCWRSS